MYTGHRFKTDKAETVDKTNVFIHNVVKENYKKNKKTRTEKKGFQTRYRNIFY